MISPELQAVLREERKRLLKDLMAINSMLGDTQQPEPDEPAAPVAVPPPFPYRTEPLAPAKVVPKVKLKQEFVLFCTPRVGQVISVKNFKAYLSANFPEGGYKDVSVGTTLRQACEDGRLEMVERGSQGPSNPSKYRIKEVAE